MEDVLVVHFLSSEEHDQMVIKSLFGIIAVSPGNRWQLNDLSKKIDIILIDVDTVSQSPEYLKAAHLAKMVVAYTKARELPSGFDAYLTKPARIRSLQALLGHIEEALVNLSFKQPTS